MCLILFAYRIRPETPLIVAANRDEFYDRPAQSAHFWPDAPELLAGRDETAGGTWLGINQRGGFAAITNFAVPSSVDSMEGSLHARNTRDVPSHSLAEGSSHVRGAPSRSPAEGSFLRGASPSRSPAEGSKQHHGDAVHSRGELTSGFLRGAATADEYARAIPGRDYHGFNLLLWDGQELVCTSNCGVTRALAPGYYGLTNAELGVAWPKVVNGIDRLRKITGAEATADALIEALHDDRTPQDNRLPCRGRPLEWERRVAPCFIRGQDYGTRASTAVIWQGNEISLTEQGYAPGGKPTHRVNFQVAG